MVNRMIFAALLCVAAVTTTWAQGTYVREGSIGNGADAAKPVESPLAFRPLASLVGEKIIFLPKLISLQKPGYDYQPLGAQSHEYTPYEQLVGKTGVIIEIRGDNPLAQHVIIRMDGDNGMSLDTMAVEGSIQDICTIKDVEDARARWLGKSLWLKGSVLETYDAANGKFGEVSLGRFAPVRVTDVVVGIFDSAPIRFILRSSTGVEGYLDVNLTGTNVHEGSRQFSRFPDTFFEADPKITFKQWPEKAWTAIGSQHIYVGMSRDQAELSWGKPRTVNATMTAAGVREQWVYADNQYLYIENNAVVAVQQSK